MGMSQPCTNLGATDLAVNDILAHNRHVGATKATVAFVGDSMTAAGNWVEWFPEHETLNHGVDGDTTDDVLERLGALIDARPDLIVLLVGTNDLGRSLRVEHLVRNIQLMLVELRRSLPGARTLVQSIMPREREFAESIYEANIHLRQFAFTVHAQYLDLWPALASADGHLRAEFTDDGLHLNEAGYSAWIAELRPALTHLSDAPPMGASTRLAG